MQSKKYEIFKNYDFEKINKFLKVLKNKKLFDVTIFSGIPVLNIPDKDEKNLST